MMLQINYKKDMKSMKLKWATNS